MAIILSEVISYNNSTQEGRPNLPYKNATIYNIKPWPSISSPRNGIIDDTAINKRNMKLGL